MYRPRALAAKYNPNSPFALVRRKDWNGPAAWSKHLKNGNLLETKKVRFFGVTNVLFSY
jgi:hypothetical protein